MFIYELFAWISCTTIVAGQFVFQPENVILRNLVIDNNTGDVFVGGVNYIYKLNKNLTQLNNVSTPCLVEECKPGETVNPNANQLLMIENLTGTPRLFACGTYSYGTCITYDMNSFSYTLLEDTIGAVASTTKYSSIALEDPSNNGILIASTRIGGAEIPKDYTLNTYESNQCRGTVKPCIGKTKEIILTNGKLKIYYILAVIVGKFRYFFSHNMDDGTNVARLCDNYNRQVEIKTYMEMPLRCVGKDGTNYEQLVAANVLRPDGKLAEKFGSTGDDDDAVLIGVFQKSSVSSQSALCTYTFQQINEFFLKNIEKCFSSNTLTLNKYVKGSTCNIEPPAACSLNSKNQKMTGTIKYESEAVVTCSECGSISSLDTTSYRGNIIAFLGAKDGKLSKVFISSNSSGQIYESTSTGIPESIISLNFDSHVASVYLLTKHKVIKVPVYNCGKLAKCDFIKGSNVRALGKNCTFDVKCTSPITFVPEATTPSLIKTTSQPFIKYHSTKKPPRLPERPAKPILQLNGNDISVTWMVNLSEEVKYYILEYKVLQDIDWIQINRSDHGHSQMNYVLKNLTRGMTYTVRIVAVNHLGKTSSEESFITVPKKVIYIERTTYSIVAFVLGAGGFALALGILVLFIWYKRRGRTNCKVLPRKACAKSKEGEGNVGNDMYEDFEMEESPEKIYASPMNNSSNTDDWEIRRENIEIEKIIGIGSFGQVAKGILKDHAGRMEQVVAIKMIKENGSDSEKNALLSELEIMKRLAKHPNVINLLGCVTKTEPQLVLITFVPNGDLLGYLRKSRGQDDKYFNDPDIKPSTDITSKHLIRFARDIACGMDFLASNKVVHRDLAARNVLLDENLVCKVTDFGMARNVKYTDEIYTRTSRVRIPVKWTAIESLMYNKCTTSSDVWSYGIVLFEIFTIGGRPYPRMKAHRVYNLLKEGYRMPKPQHVDNELYSIMLQCWNSNPEERPSFSALKKIMSKMEMKHEVYVDMSLYNSSLYESIDLEED